MEITFKSIYLFSVWCLLYLNFVKHRGASLNIHWALLHKGQTGAKGNNHMTRMSENAYVCNTSPYSWKNPFWQIIQRKLNKVLRCSHVFICHVLKDSAFWPAELYWKLIALLCNQNMLRLLHHGTWCKRLNGSIRSGKLPHKHQTTLFNRYSHLQITNVHRRLNLKCAGNKIQLTFIYTITVK